MRLAASGCGVASLSRAVPDWSGGTRIGEALRTFTQRWARRVLQRRAGRAADLGRLGPRRAGAAGARDRAAAAQLPSADLAEPADRHGDYAPLTRGLQAAMPFVDDFLPARTLTTSLTSRRT